MTVSAVNFGTTPATSFTVNSATQITAIAPAGTGTVNVRVMTSHGTSAAAPANQFTYTAPPPPTVTNVNPNTGLMAGGTNVTITGTNFTGATAVNFGATPAASFTVNSATQISAVSPPAGVAGTVNVRVTTPDGQSAIATGNQFLYTAPPLPAITSLNPNNGTATGGIPITINGTNLTGATAVHFGANTATITSNTATQIVVTLPAGTMGNVNVTVTTPNGTSAPATFNYTAALEAPIITSPDTADATEGVLFTYTITASGVPTPTIFNAMDLPDWLTRNGAVVSGTPPPSSAPGSITFTVTATNSEGVSPGVPVTVTIAERPPGWTITYTFPNIVGITPGTGGRIPLENWTGWDAATMQADMTDDLYWNAVSQETLPVQLYAKLTSDPDFIQIPFDNWSNVMSGSNRLWEWGYESPTNSVVITGSNSTGNPIQLELRKI